jgi:hypothetical protein
MMRLADAALGVPRARATGWILCYFRFPALFVSNRNALIIRVNGCKDPRPKGHESRAQG